MALPSSGQITLDQIHVEAGGTSGTQAALNDSDIRGLIGASSGAAIDFADFYGVSAFSATHTITDGLLDASTNYYGVFNQTSAGSISPTTFGGYTIKHCFRNLTDGQAESTSDFWFYLTGSSSIPAGTVSNIKIECDDGTIISLDVADATTAQSSNDRYYAWSQDEFTSSEHASFVSTFDGSGTIDIQVS